MILAYKDTNWCIMSFPTTLSKACSITPEWVISPVQPSKHSHFLMALLQLPLLTPSGSQFFGHAWMLQASPLKSSSHYQSPDQVTNSTLFCWLFTSLQKVWVFYFTNTESSLASANHEGVLKPPCMACQAQVHPDKGSLIWVKYTNKENTQKYS